MAAKDVAQRDLDQAGFRILNIGAPQTPGEATKTDNTTVPQANGVTGFAGQSLLAAPADHVHPVASNHFPYVLGFSEAEEQSQSGPDETLVAQFPIDFSPLPLGELLATIAALVDVDSGTATFNLRLGPTPDVVDGVLLATITTASPTFELQSFTSGAFVPADTRSFLKITAANDNAAVTCRIKNKTIVLKTPS
jgi:hypothetical protein